MVAGRTNSRIGWWVRQLLREQASIERSKYSAHQRDTLEEYERAERANPNGGYSVNAGNRGAYDPGGAR